MGSEVGYLIVILFCIIFALIMFAGDRKAREEIFSKSIGGTKLDRFYIECVLGDYNDFTIEKNIQKAQLLAEKYALSYPNGIEDLYEQGKQEHQAIKVRIEADDLAELREEEEKKCAALNQYADLRGKAKRIAMLKDELNSCLKRARDSEYAASSLKNAVCEKETDWAIMGGIADGLAGPAAGVSTAVNTQFENAQIRARNAENLRLAAPMLMQHWSDASNWRSSAESINKEIAEVPEKLIADTPANEVFAMLEISDSSISISKTGATTVKAKASVRNKLFIFDNVPAVADGTIVAHIMENGHEVEAVNLVLPKYGVSTEVQLTGMTLSDRIHSSIPQTVTFSGNLWLMER